MTNKRSQPVDALSVGTWNPSYMRSTHASHEIPQPTAEDLQRIGAVLRQIGGPNVNWGAVDSLDLWVVEQRIRLDERVSRRLARASWALVWTTGGLVLVTAGLIWATAAG